MIHLSNNSLVDLQSRGIKTPTYNRKNLTPAFVHIGLGAFHRAHNLSYIEDLMGKGIYTQGVHEIDLIPTSTEFMQALVTQDYLFSVLKKGPSGKEDLEIHGGIADYTNFTIDPDKVYTTLSSEQTTLISLTVTEKGYCYDSENHTLDLAHPFIINDLIVGNKVKSVVGVLSESLHTRYMTQRNPVTIMSLDNVPENGTMLRGCIHEFIARKYPDILDWVKAYVHFPNTMVDRITPATTHADIALLASQYNLEDLCGVHCEDSKTLIIENVDIPEIQMFKHAHALLVDDVTPYELMKIRLLNGAHSALSYPSYLLGYTDVDQGITDPLIQDFIRNHYMQEISASLPPVDGIDLDFYKDQLIERFSNTYIKDTLLRLASDGSKKISNAIVTPLLELEEKDSLILALAFWAAFLKGEDEKGKSIPIEDPLASVLQEKIKNDKAFMHYLGIEDEKTVETFRRFASEITTKGVKQTLESFLSK